MSSLTCSSSFIVSFIAVLQLLNKFVFVSKEFVKRTGFEARSFMVLLLRSTPSSNAVRIHKKAAYLHEIGKNKTRIFG